MEVEIYYWTSSGLDGSHNEIYDKWATRTSHDKEAACTKCKIDRFF